MIRTTAIVVALSVSALAGRVSTLPGQPAEGADQRVAALKQSLAESQARLRTYEWVQTTSISLKGEEKSRTQQRCYYGADGKLQKVPIEGAAPQAAAESGGGRRGRGRVKEHVVENKKDEMREYMERATNLMHLYVPPTAPQIQAAKDAGKIAVRPAGQRLRLELPDYVQPGDLMVIELDPAANRLAGLNVKTYLGEKDDAVTLDVRFAALADGTSYAEEIGLDATAKNIRVVIQNGGHRPLAR